MTFILRAAVGVAGRVIGTAASYGLQVCFPSSLDARVDRLRAEAKIAAAAKKPHHVCPHSLSQCAQDCQCDKTSAAPGDPGQNTSTPDVAADSPSEPELRAHSPEGRQTSDELHKQAVEFCCDALRMAFSWFVYPGSTDWDQALQLLTYMAGIDQEVGDAIGKVTVIDIFDHLQALEAQK